MTACRVLQISVLGNLAICRDGEPLLGFVSTKVQALLCYLAVTARPHSRDALVGLLWGEMPEADAKTNLRQALTNLRHLVGDHLSIDRETVTFDRAAPYWLDTEEFERTCRGAEEQESRGESRSPAPPLPCSSALDLYRGDFLDGLHVRDAPAFEEWALTQREHWREMAIQAIHALTMYHTARGEYTRGIEYATRLLALDPWREEAHRELMLLYARTGQRSAALAQYETCRRVLQEQIAVEPSAETVALCERIKSAGATPHNLPAQPTSFVGRAEEIAQIESRLLNPECRMLTLVGLGGIGKTRLALQAAAHLANIGAFLNGVFFAPLASINADSADALVFALADACGLTLTRGNPQAQLLRHLRDKEILFVLDNFEHLLAHVGLVTEMLKGARDTKFFITSRERLNVQWEWLFEVEGLGAEQAARLFVERAQQVEPRFSPGENQVHIAQICQIVQGMPLGIELASAWVKVRACAEIARTIERTFDFLATTLRDAPARQRSLRAVFDYSWQMLSAEEQRVLRALSVFRGGFTRDAAEQVAGATSSTLAALIDQSLLRHAAMGRYEMHEMVRQFAEEKLGPADELYLRHAQFYLEWIKGARKELLGAQAATWLNRIEAERANLRTALAWTLEHEHIEMTVQLNRNLWRFWYIRRYFDEGRHWTQVTLDAARRKQLPAEFMVIALDSAAGLANDVGDYAEARQLHAECLSIQRAHGDTRGIAISLNNLALVAENQGDYDFAIGCYEECLGLCRQLGEPQLVAIALTNLGNVSQFKGDYERAIALQEESVTIRRPLGDQWGLAISLMNLAEALLYRGEEQRAISLCEECLALHRQMGNERNTAYPLATLGRAMLMRGDTAQAEIFLRTSLTLLSQSTDKTNILDVLTRIVYVAVAQNKFARAAKFFGAEEALRSAIGHPLQSIDHAEHSRLLNAARNQLGATEFDATFAAGRALTLEQVVALALKEP